MTRREWLGWRKTGIGGSDAPVIMGVSKYRTIEHLYNDKTSETINEEPPNYIQQRGIDAEPRIRSLYELQAGKSFNPGLCVMAEYPFILCSLDGWTEDKTEICEIKISGKDDWELDGVPAHYTPQVQHNLMVSGASVCVFLKYLYTKQQEKILDPAKLKVVMSLPNKEYQAMLLEAEINFWKESVLKRKPPVIQSKWVPLGGMKSEIELWKQVDEQIKKLKIIQDDVRTKIIEAAEKTGNSNLVAHGLQIRKQSNAGNVDYSKIPELKDVDLNQYRKPGTSFWKFETFIKEQGQK